MLVKTGTSPQLEIPDEKSINIRKYEIQLEF